MTPEVQRRFPAVTVRLNDGRAAVVRPLTQDDAPALGDFYESVPRTDVRFYCPHPLTRDEAAAKAALSLRDEINFHLAALTR